MSRPKFAAKPTVASTAVIHSQKKQGGASERGAPCTLLSGSDVFRQFESRNSNVADLLPPDYRAKYLATGTSPVWPQVTVLIWPVPGAATKKVPGFPGRQTANSVRPSPS